MIRIGEVAEHAVLDGAVVVGGARGLQRDARMLGRADHHTDDLRARYVVVGGEVRSIDAVRDAVRRADCHVLVGIERIGGAGSSENVDEGAELIARDRVSEELHDHLRELLARDRIVRPEGAVLESPDHSQVGECRDRCRVVRVFVRVGVDIGEGSGEGGCDEDDQPKGDAERS